MVAAPALDPDEACLAIESAIQQHGDGNENQVQISVDGTIDTLSGRVRGWAEKFAVMGDIAPGVRAISDHLRVEPSGR